jgi:adenine-specific DNA-methyltransferase
VRFLDPAIGTGSFYSALRATFPAKRIGEAKGFEIDPHYGKPAAELWADTSLSITLGDFTQQPPAPRFNLLICNPPYVRHHHMQADEKARLQLRTLQSCGTKIAGLAGLYCYFLGLSHAWLSDGAVSAWLIPSEFMDVNYGQAVKRYLLNRVTLLHKRQC